MKKRVFLVIPTLHQGGAERVIAILANEFSRMGIDTHIVLLAYSKDFYSINKNVTIHRFNFKNRGKLLNIYSQLSILFKMCYLIKKHNPDSILSFMTKYNILTIISGYITHTNVYVSDRSNPNKKIPLLLEILRCITYPKAKGIIAQTSLAKSRLTQITKHNNIKVIPNPVIDIQPSYKLRKEKIILSVGRLVPEKGHKYLIEAFSQLPQLDWKLIILGEGSLRQELEDLILKLDIEDRVLLPGVVKDIDAWLHKSSIFAFPSISEGFPNALIEAMSIGLPSISFDCDAGPRDIIKHGENGFLIKTGDTTALTYYLNLLISSEEVSRKISLNCVLVKNRFAKESISKDYLDFILSN